MNPYAEDIIKSMWDDKNFLAERFGLVSIGMFSSCAAGNQNKESDLDFLVELNAPRFDWLAGLQIYLEQKFDRKIDLIRKSRRVKNSFIERIERDVIYA